MQMMIETQMILKMLLFFGMSIVSPEGPDVKIRDPEPPVNLTLSCFFPCPNIRKIALVSFRYQLNNTNYC